MKIWHGTAFVFILSIVFAPCHLSSYALHTCEHQGNVYVATSENIMKNLRANNNMINIFVIFAFLIAVSGCTSKDDLKIAINEYLEPCYYISLYPLISINDSDVSLTGMHNADILYLLDNYGIKNREEYLYEHLRNGIPIPIENEDYARWCVTVQMNKEVLKLYEKNGIEGILEKYVRKVGGDYLLWKCKSCEYLYPDSVFENVAKKNQLESIQYLLYCHNIYTYTFWYDEDPCTIIGIAAFSREEVQKHINF